MSGGSENTVSQSTIPSQLVPYYDYALSTGQNLQNQGGPQQSSGQVAPLSAMQQQGLSSIQGAASGMNPATGAANWNNYATSGALMNPSSNPYLTGEFNQGADAIQNQLSSQFGAAGRNVLASAPIQSDEMNQLATSMYGGQYDTNLNATQAAASAAPSIAQGLYTPGNQLLSAGALPQQQQQNILNTQTAQSNYNNALPYNSLSWYSSLLGQNGSPFSSSSQSGSQSGNTALEAAGGTIGLAGLLSGLFSGGSGLGAAGAGIMI